MPVLFFSELICFLFNKLVSKLEKFNKFIYRVIKMIFFIENLYLVFGHTDQGFCWPFQKPIYSTAVNQCRKLLYSIPELVVQRRHANYHVNISLNLFGLHLNHINFVGNYVLLSALCFCNLIYLFKLFGIKWQL